MGARLVPMATKETRAIRGRRRGKTLVARTLAEFAIAREAASLSQQQLARALDSSQTSVRRLLSNQLDDPGVIALSEMASVLGFEISLGLHPIGDPLRDKGQLAVGHRFEGVLAPVWRSTDETLLPGAGELRAWDKLLRLVSASPSYLVGVDIETRIRDIQALTRRTRAGTRRTGRRDPDCPRGHSDEPTPRSRAETQPW